MKILLESLTVGNFKGIRDFTLTPAGKDTTVFGRNATGKSTTFDAFTWLLFGKDSRGKADFQIKTVDKAGKEIPTLDHSAEATLSVDGKEIALKKVYKEQWTKKRGEAKKALTGHTTDHFIDGVPIQKKEWDERINGIIHEDTFKLLTNPQHFNSLHWEKRRAIIMDICGDIPDKEVVASDDKLSKLPEILGDRTLEEHRKVVKGEKTEINKRLQEVPARIDELHKSMVDVSGLNRNEIEKRIKELEEKIDGLKAGTNRSELLRKKSEVNAKLDEAVNREKRIIYEREEENRKAIAELKRQKAELEQKEKNLSANIENTQHSIQQTKETLDDLRKQYTEVSNEKHEEADACPTCGQGLPKEQIEGAQEKHNQQKAERLSRIDKQGKELKEKKDSLEASTEKQEKEKEGVQGRIAEHEEAVSEKNKELEGQMEESTGYEDTINDLREQVVELTKQIKNLSEAPDLSGPQEKLEKERGKLASIDAAKGTKERIEELKTEEKNLSARFEELEEQSYLMDQFVVRKVTLMEESINSRFELARFKLFKIHINGGVEETCETLYEGVPYNHGLNQGAQVNVGLDIIRALSDHYGVQAPIWVDRAESNSELLPIPEHQLIQLRVDVGYDELTVV